MFLIISYALYAQTTSLMEEQTANRLKAIAATTAIQINYKDLEPLHFPRDWKRSEYQRLFELLNKVRDENPDIRWAYIMRPSQQDGMWEFVVDADSNYFLSPADDYNGDGIISESEENVFPGYQYDLSFSSNMEVALERPFAETEWYSDQWGTYLSGYAPIIGANGKGVAIVGFDITVPQVRNMINSKYKPFIIIVCLSFVGLLICLEVRKRI